MHVALWPDPPGTGADVAAVYAWIDVGAADEGPGLEGAAHFIEHLVFKGTRSFGVGEVAAAIEALGGDINAWTAQEETVFHATVPGASAARAVEILAEMVRAPRFDPDELERERDVVIEEIRGGEDDVDLVVSEATWAVAFPGHAYGRSVIGTPASVGSMPRAGLIDFHGRHYVPSNAHVVVAGNFDVGAVLAAVKANFAGGPARPTRGRARPQHPLGGTTLLRRKFDTRLVRLAFPAPAHTDPAAAAAEVMVHAAGGSSASPLVASLRAMPGVFDVGLDYEAEAQGGLLVYEAQVAEGRAQAVIDEMSSQIAALRAGRLDDAEVHRARLSLAVDRRARHQSADGRAADACFALAHRGRADGWRPYDVAIAAVTRDDALASAREFFDPSRAQVVALVPRLRRLSPGWKAPRARDPEKLKAFTLDNGVRVLIEPDRSSLASIRVAGLGGQLAERPGAEGLASAWYRTVVRGAGGLGADALGRAAASLAAGIGASGGRSSQSIGMEAPAEHATAALDLLFATLLEPTFPADEVERALEGILDELASRDDAPAERLGVAMAAAAFGRQPWGLDPLGNEKSLGVVSPVTLRVAHERWMHPANLVVGIVGDVDVECVESRLRHVLGRVPVRGQPLRPQPLRVVARPRRVVLRSGRGQAHVSVMYAGIRALDPRCAALDVLGAVLNGQAGRLFTRLREEAGLAYAVGASSVDGPFGGTLTCGLATDPARLDEAERRLLEAIATIRDGEISDEEVERARAACLGGAEAGLQSSSSRCMALTYAELYGLGGPRYRALSRRAAGVSPEQVRALARELFSAPLVYGRLGPEE